MDSNNALVEKIPYFPESLGLDVSDERDLQLYVDSEGDLTLGSLLLNMRSIADEERIRAENRAPATDAFMTNLAKKVIERRHQLGFPQ